MIGITANPTEETLKLLLWAVLVLLGILIAVVGYFLSRRDNEITAINEKLKQDFIAATENLTAANSVLTEAVNQLKLVVNGLMSQYTIRQPIVDERLSKHSVSIDSHEKRINTLETEHSMFHCNYQSKKRQKPQE